MDLESTRNVYTIKTNLMLLIYCYGKSSCPLDEPRYFKPFKNAKYVIAEAHM